MPHDNPENDPAPDARATEASPEATPQQGDAPVSFVPHTPTGAVDNQPQRFRTARYGERDVSELVHILETAEDERARARFRESIYISLFIWLLIVATLIWGPKYLWHAPKIKSVGDAIREHELTVLNAPSFPHTAPVKPPTIDNNTLKHLRETERRPTPPPPAPSPEPKPQPAQPQPAPTQPAPTTAPPVTPRPAPPLPSAPEPTHRQPVPEAPAPQPSATNNPFNMSSKPNYSAHAPSTGSAPLSIGPVRGHGAGAAGIGAGAGAQILSDTQGVDFSEWMRRFQHQTQAVWEPMLPESIMPPINKRGTTVLDITILPDGTIGDMKLAGSTHDESLNKAAWGSITSQGKLQPLPSTFHGPNLVIRCYFVVQDAQ